MSDAVAVVFGVVWFMLPDAIKVPSFVVRSMTVEFSVEMESRSLLFCSLSSFLSAISSAIFAWSASTDVLLGWSSNRVSMFGSVAVGLVPVFLNSRAEARMLVYEDPWNEEPQLLQAAMTDCVLAT